MISETIKKLIRLATNNSNEQEANLAAMKACKLLVQDKTLFPTSKREERQVQNQNPKQEATIHVTENPRNRDITITVTGLDMINNSRVAALIQELDREIRRPKTYWDEARTNPYEPYRPPRKHKPFDPSDLSNYSKTKSPLDLKCKTCGNVVSTGFVGPPQVFECADCWGKDIKL